MSKNRISEKIATLDPEKDHQEIEQLLNNQIFPWDFEKSLEFALFRTFAIPSISGLLAKTREFNNRPQKRYDDTQLIMYELVDYGYDSERGRQALKRMNQMHNRFSIPNEDFLYVLSTFILEPMRWVEKYGRRPLTDLEKQAHFRFYSEVGHRMNIKGIPADLAGVEKFNRDFETQHFKFSESNRTVGDSTIDLLLSFYLHKTWLRWLWPAARRVVYSLMDEPLLDSFGYPHPSNGLRKLVQGSMRFRAWFVSLLPERKNPLNGTERYRPTYPEGYKINELGTFKE